MPFKLTFIVITIWAFFTHLDIAQNSSNIFQLTWAPPTQINPLTIRITAGKTFYGPFPPDQDLLLVFPPETILNQIKIVGGHNLRIIGGSLRPEKGIGFVLRIVDITGSAFIEGIQIDAEKLTGDGINVSGKAGFTPNVYIQNCRIMNINGFNKGEHADIFQAQGPIGSLFIDHLTGSSNYQGIFIPTEFEISSAIIRNTNLSYYSKPQDPVTYLLWIGNFNILTHPYPVLLDALYIVPRSEQSVGHHAVNPTDASASSPATEANGRVTWPEGSLISGCVISGSPPQGDFVPDRADNVVYTSPGYRGGFGKDK